MKRQLRIVPDTNIIYTERALQLLRNEVIEMIRSSADIDEYRIEWHIPRIVLDERQFQMNKSFGKHLDQVERLQELIGSNFDISKEKISRSINSKTDEIIKELGISTIELDYKKVDWEKMVSSSVQRKLPFEDGTKEKGFRDAIVLESFYQLLEDSNLESTTMIFISNDKIVKKALSENVTDEIYEKLSVYDSLSELRNFLNILKSQSQEKEIGMIREESHKLFYTEDDQDSIILKEGITEEIEERFHRELHELKSHAEKRINNGYNIREPIFLKKEGNQITWETFLERPFKLFISENIYPDQFNLYGGSYLEPVAFGSVGSSLYDPLARHGYWKDSYVGRGISKFSVIWSIEIDEESQIGNISVDDLKFVDTDWDLLYGNSR